MAYWKPKKALDLSKHFLVLSFDFFGYMNYRQKIGWSENHRISFIHSFFHSFIHSYEKIAAMIDDWRLTLCAHEVPRSPPLVAFLVDDYHQAHALLLVLLDIDHPWATVIHLRSRVKRLRERASERRRTVARKETRAPGASRKGERRLRRACLRAAALAFDADFRVCDVMLISWSVYD